MAHQQKDQLVELTGQQQHPGYSRPEDFTVMTSAEAAKRRQGVQPLLAHRWFVS